MNYVSLVHKISTDPSNWGSPAYSAYFLQDILKINIFPRLPFSINTMIFMWRFFKTIKTF